MAISSQTSNYTSYKYIVTANEPGPFHTIQSCLDYVQALGESTTIFVRPGTYTEDLTLYSGINIMGSSEGQVIIYGEHTPPDSGSIIFTNITLRSDSSVLVSAVAGTTDIMFKDCTFKTSIFVVDCINWSGYIHFDSCLEQSISNGILNNTGGSALEILDSSLGSGVTSMVASGVTRIYGSRIYVPITLSGPSYIDTSYLEGSVVITGTEDVTLTGTKINSGSDTAIIATTTGLVTVENCTINATGLLAIDGSSSVKLVSCSFSDVDDIAGSIVLPLNSEFRASKGKFQSLLEITDGALSVNGTGYGNNGQVLIGNTATNKAVWASITTTGVLEKTEGAGSLTLHVPSLGLPYVVATSDITAVSNTAYSVQHATPASLLTITLPAVVDSTAGDVIHIMGYTAGGWSIAQSDASHQIIFGNQATTVGATGSLSSTNQYDCVTIRCITGSIWQVETGPQGNLTVV